MLLIHNLNLCILVYLPIIFSFRENLMLRIQFLYIGEDWYHLLSLTATEPFSLISALPLMFLIIHSLSIIDNFPNESLKYFQHQKKELRDIEKFESLIIYNWRLISKYSYTYIRIYRVLRVSIKWWQLIFFTGC